jgi:hypothetical protein
VVKCFQSEDCTQRISSNFKVGEFACKCGRCTQLLVDEKLVEWLQKLRDHYNAPVNINSGYRCKTHNAAVGGDPGSHHMKGMAADIWIPGVEPADIARYAETIGIKRIGLYEGDQEGNFVHIGSSESKRFWLGHAGVIVDTFMPTENVFELTLPVLTRGKRGTAVKALQAALVGYGYDINVDSSFGPATEAAVRKYQSDNRLTVDGKAGPETRKHMLGI